MSALPLRALRLVLPAFIVLAGACKGSDDEGKVSLAQANAQAAHPQTSSVRDALPVAARSALDSGNAQYRGGKYKEALASYRAAAKAAPDNSAPYFGIYMAAQKLGDTKLADSASAEIAKRSNNQMLSDSSLRSIHKGN